MGFVGTAIGFVINVIAESSFAQFILATALSWGINELFGSKTPEELDTTQAIRGNTRSTEEDIPLIYGAPRFGGNQVFVQEASADNKDLWIVQTIGEGECDLTDIKVYLDDKRVANDGIADATTNPVCEDFGGNVQWWVKYGTSDQTVETNIYNAVSSRVNFDDTMRNTAYLVIKLHYDTNYFNSIPQITIEGKGLKIYNLETGETEWSDNVVWCLYNYMTNTRYGRGMNEDYFDEDSWIEAADKIDILGWSYNRVIKSMNSDAIIEDMKKHGRLDIIWRPCDNKFFCYHKEYESSAVMSITDNHILQDNNSGKALINITEPSRFSSPDALRLTFLDEDKENIANPVIIGDPQASEDRIEDFELLGCTNIENAIAIASYHLERMQACALVKGQFRGDCWRLEPSDPITITASALGLNQWDMRVVSVGYSADHRIELELEEEHSTLYDKTYNSQGVDYYECSLPDRNKEPPNPIVTISEYTYNFRKRSAIRLFIEMAMPSTYELCNKVHVWISFDEGTTWKYLYWVEPDNFFYDNVQEGKTYWFKFQPENIWHSKRSFSNSLVETLDIEGYKSIRPPSLNKLFITVNSPNSISIYSDIVDDPDIEWYEWRVGPSFDSAVFLAANNAPAFGLPGIKPGDHTFWVNTLGKNELYGLIPKSVAASINDPPDGWDNSSSWCQHIDDFTNSDCDFGLNMELSGNNLVCKHDIMDYAFLEEIGEYFDARWRFDGNANDDIGSKNLTLIGSPTYTNGVSNQCIDFNGAQYGYCASTARDALNPTSVSFGCWVNISSLPSGYGYVCTKPYSYGITVHSDGQLGACFVTSAMEWVKSHDNAIADSVYLEAGRWYYVAASYDENTAIMKLYIDRALVAQMTHSVGGQLLANDAYFSVASFMGAGYYLACEIDELNVAGQILTDKEILEWYELDIYKGIYLSPIITPGIATPSYRTLVYILSTISVTGVGDEWNDYIDNYTTGRQLGMTTKSFLEIFEISGGAKVEIKLIYIDNASIPSGWPSGCDEVGLMEIQSAIVNGRHFQAQVKITDPNNSCFVNVGELEFNFCENII